MTEYNKIEDYSAKDSLASGDPEKVVTGQELDQEFTQISAAVNSRIVNPATKSTGQFLKYDGVDWVADNVAAAVGVPIGTIIAYVGTSDTGDYLLCDGRSLSNAGGGPYAALYAIIGNNYGSGAGTFNLPDLRGRLPVGLDDMGTGQGAANRLDNTVFDKTNSDTLGGEGGQDSITSVPSHAHTGSSLSVSGTISATANNQTAGGSNSLQIAADGDSPGTVDLTGSGLLTLSTGGLTISGSTGATGASAVETMPPFVMVNYLIKYQ